MQLRDEPAGGSDRENSDDDESCDNAIGQLRPRAESNEPMSSSTQEGPERAKAPPRKRTCVDKKTMKQRWFSFVSVEVRIFELFGVERNGSENFFWFNVFVSIKKTKKKLGRSDFFFKLQTMILTY